VFARIHRDRDTELGRIEGSSVAPHLEAGRRLTLERHRQPREALLERVGSLASELLAFSRAARPRQRNGFAKLRPSARGFPAALIALGQIEQSPDTGVELLARLELRAGFLHPAVCQKATAFGE
jgi:hypothetical protein